jgi:hypothetical protein
VKGELPSIKGPGENGIYWSTVNIKVKAVTPPAHYESTTDPNSLKNV